eukprot:7881992-Pyramimonas_sp.AAC.1
MAEVKASAEVKAAVAENRVEDAAKEEATKRADRKRRAKLLREAIENAKRKLARSTQQEDAVVRDRGVGDIPALSGAGGDVDDGSDDGGGGGTPHGSPSRHAADDLGRG